MSINFSTLCQLWVHSQEEDTQTETVYRPADFEFPPSRGRSALEFNRDGSFKRIRIGANDVSAVSEGNWKIAEPDSDRIQVELSNGREDLAVQSLVRDRLTISKRS
jgi:hypothetical protein